MPIELNCSGCQRRLRVADEHAGKQARCPQCGAVMAVPTLEKSLDQPPQGILDPGGLSSGNPFGEAKVPENPISASQFPIKQGPPWNQGTNPASDASSSTGSEMWTMTGPDGLRYGPVNRQELDRWAAEGRISPQATLQRTGDANGISAIAIYPRLAYAPAHNPQRVTTIDSHAGQTVNPFADQYSPVRTGFGPHSFHGRNHRGGLILGLGIAALATAFICCIGTIPSLGLGIAAVVMGTADLKAIRTGTMDPAGHGSTTAGLICGAIGIAISGIWLIFFLISNVR